MLRRESLREQASSTLRTWIVTGEIHPGEIYAVGPLAAKLGVSTTPVREAVLDLANEGLLEMIRNRGFRVPPVTEHDLDELFQLRLLLEVPGMELVVGELSARQLSSAAELARKTTQAAAAGDVARFLDYDRHFHAFLLDLQPNRRLANLVSKLRDQTRLYGLPELADTGHLTENLTEGAREHVEIVAALERCSSEDVRKWMVKHIRHTRGKWAGRNESVGGAMLQGSNVEVVDSDRLRQTAAGDSA